MYFLNIGHSQASSFIFPTVLLVYSFTVSYFSVLYIESKLFYFLLIPALLLDMDQMMSQISLMSDKPQSFYRVHAILSLFLPYAGVIAAVAVRSIVRTESLFMYHDYLDLCINHELKKSQKDDIFVKKSVLFKIPRAIYDVTVECCCVILTCIGYTFFPTEMSVERNQDVRFELNISPKHSALHSPNLSPKNANGQKHSEKWKITNYNLTIHFFWMCVSSSNCRSRIYRMIYDWAFMRDCLVELQCCSGKYAFIIKLVCLRLVPFVVVARLFLVHMDPTALSNASCGDNNCQPLNVMLGGIVTEDSQLSSSLISRILITATHPFGSFLFAFFFTMIVLFKN